MVSKDRFVTAEWKTRGRENSGEKVALVMEKFIQTTAFQSGMVCDGRPQQKTFK